MCLSCAGAAAEQRPADAVSDAVVEMVEMAVAAAEQLQSGSVVGVTAAAVSQHLKPPGGGTRCGSALPTLAPARQPHCT